ncbi:acidic endochitinase-like, partial [Olea europaea subsp. europaea]
MGMKGYLLKPVPQETTNSFLATLGNGQKPMINLTGHCDPYSNVCAGLSSKIKSCQAKGIKVILSIGGGARGYILASTQGCKGFGNLPLEQLLGWEILVSPSRNAVLDGIDFNIEGGTSQHWDYIF